MIPTFQRSPAWRALHVPAELEPVLKSGGFNKAPTLKKLLLYLWEQRTSEVSEYAIATEALGRREDFDPRTDASVRVQVARLRQRLKDFYESPEGLALSTRILVPLGGHQIQIVEAEVAVEANLPERVAIEAEAVEFVEPGFVHQRWLLPALAVAIVVLVLTNVLTFLFLNKPSKQGVAAARELPKFWSDFLATGDQHARIILPNPVFFGWPNGLIARDFKVNAFRDLQASTTLRPLVDQFGKPELSQYYVSTSDVYAALRLNRYLDPTGSMISISSSADSPMGSLDQGNLILLGTPNTLTPFQGLLDKLDFKLDANKDQITDLHPDQGAPKTYEAVTEATARVVTPGVIAVVPGQSAGSRILLVVATEHTAALIEYLTSANGMRELEGARATHGNSPFFEAVILSELNLNTPLSTHLAAFHSLPIKK